MKLDAERFPIAPGIPLLERDEGKEDWECEGDGEGEGLGLPA